MISWTQIRPIKMLGLILIQIVWHSDGNSWKIILRFFFWQKWAEDEKSMKNYPACQELGSPQAAGTINKFQERAVKIFEGATYLIK